MKQIGVLLIYMFFLSVLGGCDGGGSSGGSGTVGCSANQECLWGRVVSVADGDTITILDSNNQQYKIRLYGIDSPESRQPYGKAAKSLTSDLTYGKQAEVIVYDTDRYGRTVGVVVVNGLNVNRRTIEAGYAWQYQQYCKAAFCKQWLQVEEQARLAGVGLWSDPNPIPPWDWRKGTRN